MRQFLRDYPNTGIYIISGLVTIIGFLAVNGIYSILDQGKANAANQQRLLDRMDKGQREHQKKIFEHEKRIDENSWRITTIEKEIE